MKHRRLGRSGLSVSEIAFGNWVTHGSQVEEDAAKACVHAALDAGITTFTPDGDVTKFPIAGDSSVTNIAFGGEDMRDAYITLSETGRLVRIRWDEPGLKLAFNG